MHILLTFLLLSRQRRAFWEPKIALVTGAGPLGLLGAMIGKRMGLEVHVIDRMTSGLKPDLVEAMGAAYHSCSVSEIDLHLI